MVPWHIGNTSVRTPYRLIDALQVLKNSEFHGNLVGKDREEGFANLLYQRGVVTAERISRGDGSDVSDLGRKWRSALAQLGFVVPHITQRLKIGGDPKIEPFITGFPGLTGRPYEITPNGQNLIDADSAAAQQECFLRSLVVYRIPSIFEPRYKFPPFSPLLFVLRILLLIEKRRGDPVIRFEEMALIVQRRTPGIGLDNLDNVVSEILSYREDRDKSQNKKKFDGNRFLEAGDGILKKARTLKDYADLNFRYLKATGLFQSRGRAIALIPEKKTLIELLVSEKDEIFDKDSTYVKALWSGARLPTDDKINTINITRSLLSQLKEHDLGYAIPDLNERSLPELSQIRHRLEERLHGYKELAFAERQAGQWQEIAGIMKAFKDSKREIISDEGQKQKIPAGEAPAYFEWIIWRAFLAINSLENNPQEARKFKIDQDFLPLSHAPGGGPDMVFEFEEFVLVVEVTLTSSSRQEAAEGEPVRRHVAEIAEQFEKHDKDVYCLFIALTIDSNTAETFKIGTWYKKDDSKLPLQIVPFTLEDFILLFEAGFESGKRTINPMKIRHLLTECRALSNRDAPEWKKIISSQIKKFIAKL